MKKHIEKSMNIGWIGLGVMGAPMCQHLLAAGYSIAVYTRSKEKAKTVIESGAHWCRSPMEVTERSSVIFTMVGSESEVHDIYFAKDGLFDDAITGRVFIDMGTTAPSLTQRLASYAQEHGAETIDAPVSGGDVGARNACLSIMAGGEKSTLNRLAPLFSCLGKVQHMGDIGSGQHTKMCNQIIVAGTMIGVCEALLYAKSAGLDGYTLISAITKGAAGCWTLDNLAPRVLKQDFASGFMVEHFIKDLEIAVNEAQAMGLDLPGLALVKSLYERVRDLGHGKSATQALLLALESASLQ